MKTIHYIAIVCFLAITTAFSQSKEHFVKITFNDGPLQGTHTFYPEKGNYASQANIEFFKGASNVNASKLITQDGFQMHYINRYFMGESIVGMHQPKKSTSGCGSLNFIDFINSQTYKKIDGDFIGCTPTTITKVTAWKEGIVKKRRTVSGHFEDTLRMKIRNDDGSEETLETTVKVTFSVNESKRK
ncbi:hypothetical protein KORDIASMS9_02884 [Kordia sp. SMS9]|uniref:hypothetical protein n=1 Tax=Kordia sp. SMS9 TaxID=2282170 RepID=UPI000E0D4CF9|nr:hypothetical protein [Kordia sp. SMS9]AXG70643.1 hypothetical protein KORDIASMS9_02884 [Kordia sp. SMS9]